MQKKLLSEDHTVRDVLCLVVPGHLVAVEAERALAAGVDGLDGFLFAGVIELVVLPDAVAVVDIEAFAVFIEVAAHRPLAVLPGAAGPVDVDLDGVVGNTLDIDRAAVAAVTALETLDRAAGSFGRLLSRFLSGFLGSLLRGLLSCFLCGLLGGVLGGLLGSLQSCGLVLQSLRRLFGLLCDDRRGSGGDRDGLVRLLVAADQSKGHGEHEYDSDKCSE